MKAGWSDRDALFRIAFYAKGTHGGQILGAAVESSVAEG